MPSALPQPGTGADGSPAPETPPKALDAGFWIGWTLFRLATWATIAVWIHPKLLNTIGGHGLAAWLLDHGWVRILGIPPLFLLGALSMSQVTDGSRSNPRHRALAEELGATLADGPGLDRTYGIRKGPVVRVPAGRWTMEAGVWSARSVTRTVARIRVEGATEFSFMARGASREPAMLRGFQQQAIGDALREAAERQGDARAAVTAYALAYLGGPPMQTGSDALDRTMVLRANQPDVARELFTHGPVTSAAESLCERTLRWEWTYYPGDAPGTTEMSLQCPGTWNDAESLRLLRDVCQAALEHLAERSVIAS